MARPRKKGLDYWPCDVDFFLDEKVAAIVGEFGLKGESIVIHLLCAIYREGYFIMWTEMLQMKLLRELPDVSAGLLASVVNRLVKWGFFDASLFDSQGILTSAGIQRRYFSAARRKITADCKFLLGNEVSAESEEIPDGQMMFGETLDDGSGFSTDIGFCDKNDDYDDVFAAKTTERKEKKTKVNKETTSCDVAKKDQVSVFEGQVVVTPAENVDTRRQDFYNSLVPYVEKYGRAMIRDFYDYWSEVSDGGRKMKWEKVRDQRNGTWNLSGRLATWKRHESKYSGSAGAGRRGLSMSQAIITAIQPAEVQGQDDGISITKLLGDGIKGD